MARPDGIPGRDVGNAMPSLSARRGNTLRAEAVARSPELSLLSRRSHKPRARLLRLASDASATPINHCSVLTTNRRRPICMPDSFGNQWPNERSKTHLREQRRRKRAESIAILPCDMNVIEPADLQV